MSLIRTTFINPPLPIRDCDWHAAFDGYEPGDIFGRGATELAAINDLFDRRDDGVVYEIVAIG